MKVWSIFFPCYTYQDVSHWTSDIKIDYKNSLSSDIVICLRNDKYSFVVNLSIYTGINLILYNRKLGIFQNLNEREFTYTAVPKRLLLHEAIYGNWLLYIPYINWWQSDEWRVSHRIYFPANRKELWSEKKNLNCQRE